MIRIENLTERQRQIMDLLWSCKNIEQVNTLISALPSTRDQCDAQSLVKIATWETLEQEGCLERFAEDAENCISRCCRS